MNLTGDDLIKIGFTESKALGIALELAQTKLAHLEGEELLNSFAQVLAQPAAFVKDEIYAALATELTKPASDVIALNDQTLAYSIYGAEAIEAAALKQMETAMKLPVTVAGALMPDAHQGYGLPIGGVPATNT